MTQTDPQTHLPPKTRQPKPRTHTHHTRNSQPPHIPNPRHQRIYHNTPPPREPRPKRAHERNPRALGLRIGREQGLGRGGVVGLEDAVGLVEADRYADREEAGEEDEGLAARGYGAEVVLGLGGRGVGWGGVIFCCVGGGRGVVGREFGF